MSSARPPSLYSIPAGVPFATSLARGIVDHLASEPETLARATILVPSRRAALALRAAFLEVRGSAATLLPRIDPIGDVAEDEPDMLGFADDAGDLSPAIDPLERQLILARLLRGFSLGGVAPTPPQTMLLAESLGRLLDALNNADADPAMLRDLLPERYSVHWQDILKLLTILIERWPAILADGGVIDAADRRNRLLRLRCAVWNESPPAHLVIVAGSTGTFAATRELIACVAGLPNGHVVLPGLDGQAVEYWDIVRSEAGHPQHQLSVLLDSLQVTPQAVRDWPGTPPQTSLAHLRRDLMREAFKPAALTSDWRQLGSNRPDLGRDALIGLSFVTSPNRAAEAGVIALVMREVLETPEKTAALITPDRQLAEAVIAALRRWKIDVDDSAGRPLTQCRVGGFLQLLVSMVAEEFAPLPTLSFLKHPLAAGGLLPAEFRSLSRLLERRVFRGYRPPAGIDGILSRLPPGSQLHDFVSRHIAAPLADFQNAWRMTAPTLSGLAQALGNAAERMAARRLLDDGSIDEADGAVALWEHEDGAAAADLLASLAQRGGGFDIDAASFPSILRQLMNGRMVRQTWQTHPRLSILGPVEARMQSADRLIVAGFNEGNWPPRPEIDPWTNAEMRAAAGLQPHNWRTGLSAHDVWMALCAPEVIVTRSVRDGDAVTIPSRWLQRFEAVLAALQISHVLDRGQALSAHLAALSPSPPLDPASRPQPCPPVATRPREFSATEIDEWIRDPYSIYAKRILGLRQLDDIDRQPDPALRGTLVHDALAAFIEAHPEGQLGDDALAELRAIGRRVFEPYWNHVSTRVFWWPAFELVSGWFIETERRRRETLLLGHTEIDGRLTLQAPAGDAVIKARADRIDQMQDGRLVILDYKTGTAPRPAEVAEGRRTQLTTEALIAANGGFEGVAAADIAAMQYWKLAGRRNEIGSITNVMPDAWDADVMLSQISSLVAKFDRLETSYASLPDLSLRSAFPRYDHLARVDEWRSTDSDGAQAVTAILPPPMDADGSDENSFDMRVADDASRQQAAASDPHCSVFVSANAGTGKTKLLTDRVLRLMLDGAPPESILCVTYTRTAAAEMRNRISDRLAAWTVMTSEALNADLASMGIAVPSQQMLQRARSLFAEILDTDDGPRVETVHSFCQSVLRRFPIEAGIVPNAELADEIEQARLKAQARDAVMNRGDPALDAAIATLAEQTAESNLEDLLSNLLRAESRLGDEDILARLASHLQKDRGIDASIDLKDMTETAIAGIDVEALRAAAMAIGADGKAEHQKRAAIFTSWLGETAEGRVHHIDLLIAALFTENGPRKRMTNKDIRGAYPAIDDVLAAMQDQLAPVLAARADRRCYDLTTSLYGYAVALMKEYRLLKRRLGLLDYDDLISLTNEMLDRGDAAAWVSWKLDNSIRHMLIDEAQDTSMPQWSLLRRLSDEFFESDSDDPASRRTIFIVGDFKQSIYSFQGAEPAVMGQTRMQLQEKAVALRHPFRDLALDVSFRTAQPVLDLVNRAVADLDGITDPPRMPDFAQHRTARTAAGGFVEIWPVMQDVAEPVDLPAFAPPEIAQPRDAAAQSAADVARRISEMIGVHRLASGRPVRPGDIMILLRNRGDYYRLLLAALQRAGLPVAGADRMKLHEQIEIQDLLALGDVMLLPEDDLQLAAVLKSPLFNLDEDGLFALAHGRGRDSLHARLMAHAGADTEFGRIADSFSTFRRLADGVSVFSFFSGVLAESRKDFRRRLGRAVDESLDHFLTLAQSFGTAGGVSLTEFLALVRGSGGEVRRDMDSAAADEIRVMTIHGAKGLEAPILILPDMLKSSSRRDQLIPDPESGFVYWAPKSGGRPEFVTTAKTTADQAAAREENRLLYVALTRARDGVFIGGWEARHRRTMKTSAYEGVRAAFSDMPGVVAFEDGTLRLAEPGSGRAPEHAPDQAASQLASPVDPDLPPSWLFETAPEEPRPPRPLRPSLIDGAADAPSAPGTRLASLSMAMARGRLAHRMFEVLPDVAPDIREAAGQRMMESQTELSAQAARLLLAEVTEIMRMPELAPLFGAGSLAEVSVTGLVGGAGVAGQIDRLYVGSDQIIIADFKTGPMPGKMPDAYQRQLALYAALVEQLYPGRVVTAWLVWTEAASVQEVTPQMRAAALAALHLDLKDSPPVTA